MMNETHKRLTKHFRNRLKAAGIKAGCRAFVSCGVQYIQINTPTYEALFTEQQQREILTIAKVSGLTLSRGMEINTEQMTYGHGGSFVVPPNKL